MGVGSNMVTSQVNVTTSATLLCAARRGRKEFHIFTGDAVMFIGPDNAVTSSTGFSRSGPNNYNLTLGYDGDVYAVMSSGSGTASVLEVF
jgi:hypothetical protein